VKFEALVELSRQRSWLGRGIEIEFLAIEALRGMP
jgi:hypothetical protein